MILNKWWDAALAVIGNKYSAGAPAGKLRYIKAS